MRPLLSGVGGGVEVAAVHAVIKAAERNATRRRIPLYSTAIRFWFGTYSRDLATLRFFAKALPIERRESTALVVLVLLVVVLASNGAFNPQDGGGIHIGIGR